MTYSPLTYTLNRRNVVLILILCLCLHESQLTAGKLSHAEYAAAVNRLARAAELLEVNDAR